MSYVFSFTFFHCRSFSPCIGSRYHFSFCHRRYKILMFFQQNKYLFCYFVFSRSGSLFPFFSLNFAGLPPTLSLFLCLSLALYSKFVDMTITLSLILQTTRIQKHLQDAGDYAISHQNNFELHLGCHTCRLNYFTLVYLWCGRTVVRFMVT